MGKRIQRAAGQAGLNYREVAEAANVPYGWVRQVAHGGINRPDAERLRALARVLPVEADELLALSDQLGATLGEVGERRPEPSDVGQAIREQTAMFDRRFGELLDLLRQRPSLASWPPEAAAVGLEMLERAAALRAGSDEPAAADPSPPRTDRSAGRTGVLAAQGKGPTAG